MIKEVTQKKRDWPAIKELMEEANTDEIHLKLEKGSQLSINDVSTIQMLYLKDFISAAEENSKTSIDLTKTSLELSKNSLRLSKAMAWIAGALIIVQVIEIILRICKVL